MIISQNLKTDYNGDTEILSPFLIRMKNFWTKFSVTKLVFLLMTLCLVFQAIYLTLQGVETSLFNNCMLAIISFYFWQKVWKTQSDPLIDNDWDNDKI